MTENFIDHTLDMRAWGAQENDLKTAAEYPQWTLGRILSQSHDRYRVVGEPGEALGAVSGAFRHAAKETTDYPAVGDFVLYDALDGAAQIHRVLPRRSAFARPVAGTRRDLQIVAANVDVLLICMALDDNFNLNRLERYLAVGFSSGGRPIVVLTKADLCLDLPARLAQVREAAAGAEILATSALAPETLLPLKELLRPGMTASFIGSSGVGKSTMINALSGEERMRTAAVSELKARGRHTTTHRELMMLPGGVLVIDTPGMRALGVDGSDADTAFEDVEALATRCKFRDCTHHSEPGCAVKQAIEDGTLDPRRLQSYLTLKNEAGYGGLSSRGIEQEKIRRMFGGKGEMKRMRDDVKRRAK